MGKRVMVFAPHPDDETIGCGGTLLRHRFEGDSVYWVILSTITKETSYPYEILQKREQEILQVSREYDFTSIEQLKFPTTLLDTIPLANLINSLATVLTKIQPEIVYIPFPGDVHSDHGVSFKVIESCSKWFRFPSIKKILAYETLSETEFGLNPCNARFCPNVFVDITNFIERKIEIFSIYQSEMGEFPFPRSEKAIRSFSVFRGASSGYQAAEAFMLLLERY